MLLDSNAAEISRHRLAIGAPPRCAGQQKRLLTGEAIDGALLRLRMDAHIGDIAQPDADLGIRRIGIQREPERL